jgi:hypothetical protein
MHLLAGSWIANLEQSQRDPQHQFQRATIRIEVSAETVSLVYGGVNASGRHEHGTQILHTDGEEHAVPEAPGVVVVSTLEPRVLHTLGKQGDAVVGHATYEVHEDSGTMTATVSGLDASGKSFSQVVVFDREV